MCWLAGMYYISLSVVSFRNRRWNGSTIDTALSVSLGDAVERVVHPPSNSHRVCPTEECTPVPREDCPAPYPCRPSADTPAAVHGLLPPEAFAASPGLQESQSRALGEAHGLLLTQRVYIAALERQLQQHTAEEQEQQEDEEEGEEGEGEGQDPLQDSISREQEQEQGDVTPGREQSQGEEQEQEQERVRLMREEECPAHCRLGLSRPPCPVYIVDPCCICLPPPTCISLSRPGSEGWEGDGLALEPPDASLEDICKQYIETQVSSCCLLDVLCI